MVRRKQSRLKDLLVIISLVLVSIPLTIFGHVNFLFSTLLFFGLPSVYLIWRKPINLKKATLAGIILGLVLGFSFDFVAEFNHAWGWQAHFALPATFFGIVSLDVLVWYFLWVFLVIAYYEYFVEHDKSMTISSSAKWVFAFGLLLAASIVITWNTSPDLLLLSNAYAKLGTITFILCALLLFKNPRLVHKILQVLPFFIFMYLAYEITALSMGLWTFPGAYLASVKIEVVSFPIEELFVWIVASSAIVATYYEFCIDDGR